MAKRLGVRERDSGMARSVADVAGPDEHAGAGRYEEIAVAQIVGNERNPRFQAITPDQVRGLREQALAAAGEGASSSEFFDTVSHQIDELELADTDQLTASDSRGRLHSIAALAQSIGKINLISPIVVYPLEEGYEVLAGQRRYLAHVLLGRREIRAIVRQPTGDRLNDNLAAVVENLAREELTLRERVEAIEEIVRLHEESGKEMNASGLQEYLGESKRTCQRYLRIVREPAVRDAIRSGEVRSLRQASQLVDPAGGPSGNAPDEEQERSHLTRSAPVTRSKDGQADAGTRAPASSPAQRGRRKTRVNLGSSSECDAVRRLMTGYLGEEGLEASFAEVDWEDYSSVEKAWKQFWADHIATGEQG